MSVYPRDETKEWSADFYYIKKCLCYRLDYLACNIILGKKFQTLQ